MAGHVGELVAADYVADGENALVGRAQSRIDGDSGLAMGDPGGLETEVADVGPAAHRDQQVRALDAPLGAVLGNDDRDARCVRLDARDLDTFDHVDAIGRKAPT